MEKYPEIEIIQGKKVIDDLNLLNKDIDTTK
jgi:hypothetical protein